MSLFHAGVQPALDEDGNPISGATWNFYSTGTLTALPVYDEDDLSTSLGAVITADADGRFDPAFLDDDTAYRAILKDAGGTTITDIDPINGTDSNGAWVNVKSYGAVGDGVTNDTAAIAAAIAATSTLSRKRLLFPPGTYLTPSQVTFNIAGLVVEGFGATVSSTLDGRAFAFSGADMKILGLTMDMAATGADPAPYAEVSAANVNIIGCTFTRAADAHIPLYVRAAATGFRFRNNHCTWYGGINMISNVKDAEVTGNSFINPGAASDDGIAIKAIAGIAESILIADNYFENMADFVGIGSEIGVQGTTDATYANIVRGVTITGNRGKNCSCMVFIKPGAVDGVDYRDGTVRGVTISDNTLIDASGTNMVHGVRIAAGRGARIYDVTGRNNRVIGRSMTGGTNSAGLYVFIRNDGNGTADCVIDKVDVAVEIFDPYDGAAAGGSAPGSPFPSFVNLEKASAAFGTATGIVLDVIGNGCGTSGIRVQAGFDNAVVVRRALLTNVDTNGSSSFGGIHTDSIIKVDDDIQMTMAAGSSGVQYKFGGSGAVTPLYPQQFPAFSLLGNSAAAAATAGPVTGVSRVLAQSAVAIPLTGTTNETTLVTVNLSAGLIGINGRIDVEADFTYPSSANVKTMRVKLGATTTWNTTPTTTTHALGKIAIANRGAANSQRWSAQHTLSSNVIADTAGTAAIDTSGATTLTITGQLASAAETLTLEAYRVVLTSLA
jgi:hypothetical protein